MNALLKMAFGSLGPIAAAAARNALANILNSAYREFWRLVLDAVKKAEQEFTQGAIKKEWVTLKVMDYILSKKKLSRFRERVVRRLVGVVVDRIIDELNRDGKNWVKTVSDLEIRLNEKLRIIDPVY
jgi:hypothetical protein